MSFILRLAACYNLLWGAWVILFPHTLFTWTGMEQPAYPMIWQGMGMVIGVYGLGYWWASYDPIRHWPIVAVGFLGKIFGPIGFLYNYILGDVPASFAYMLIGNDLIWWLPFAYIIKNVADAGWPLRSSASNLNSTPSV